MQILFSNRAGDFFDKKRFVFTYCTKTNRFVCVLLPVNGLVFRLQVYYNKLSPKNQVFFEKFVLTAQKKFYIIIVVIEKIWFFKANRFALFRIQEVTYGNH